MVNHDILGLDISVHDAERVAVVQSFEHLVNVVLALFGFYDLKQLLVIDSIDMLEHQTVSLALPKFDTFNT